MRRTMFWVFTAATLTLGMAFADGKPHKSSFQRYEGPAISVRPQRMMKVRVENGRLVPVTPWVQVGDFAPAGPCDPNEVLVWDHFGADANGNPTGGENCDSLFAPDDRYYFGDAYNNPYYANDIETLVDSQYNGGVATSLAHAWFWNAGGQGNSQNCVVLVFTVEDLDTTCATDVHDIFEATNSAIEGVVLDYGSLPSSIGLGYYSDTVCLNPIGGLQLPSQPDSNGVLGGYVVVYASAFDSTTGTVTPAAGAQPMLWSPEITGIGTSTPKQWDDDDPVDYNHGTGECYNYAYNGLCQNMTNVTIWGGMMAFWASTGGCQSNNGDVNGDGCVDDADLLSVLFAFGGTGGAEDTNCDGVVDDADLLTVLFNFGAGC